jgi:hypothetical protein
VNYIHILGMKVIIKTSGENMKLLSLVAMLFTLNAMADSTTICDDLPFADISSIKISIHHGDVFVTEYGTALQEPILSITNESMEGNFSQELTEWNGYTRVLSKENGEITLTVADECSSDSFALKCKVQ